MNKKQRSCDGQGRLFLRVNEPKKTDARTRGQNLLVNYKDTKAKRHLKKLTYKETLRQVFIRVYRREIKSAMLGFSI
jgi:hypothetical protein